MLILARHGRTEANAAGLLLGRLDPALDEVGRRQAVALADGLGRGGTVDEVVASPLRRTRETAAAIAEGTGAPVTVDERWIELDYGAFDGVPLADIPVETWARWRGDPTFAPPGGESLAELGVRVRVVLDELSDRARDRTVVVVSHVSPIKAAVAWALGVGDEVTWRLFVAPASLTRIAVTERGPVVQSFNEVAHLER
ncbi:MAG: histidine phosphatase family protein [Acidimicrobiales bacterium]|nr:histidine phosphatase family protein [Acidimicrobiales bacterium]